MGRAFRGFWSALKDMFDEFFLLVVCNAIWSAFSLPIFTYALWVLVNGVIGLGVILLLVAVVPAAPATGALFYVAQRVAEGRATRFGEFFRGVRRYALRSWALLGTWTIGLLLIVFNLNFYFSVANSLGYALSFLFLYLLVIWLGVLIYLFPLMLLNPASRLRQVARQAFIMTLGRPVFTFTTLLLMILVSAFSILLPALFFFFTVALLAQASVRATQELSREAEERRAAAEAERAAAAPEKGRRGQVRPK